MNDIKQFIKIWNYSINSQNISYIFHKSIPTIWQIILTSDGSFTRNASIINSNDINIKLIKHDTELLTTNIHHKDQDVNKEKHRAYQTNIREVWLMHNNKKIAFAQSCWHSNYKQSSFFSKHRAIGKTFIISETNIHRELKSLYLGYSIYLENNFKSEGPLWGRSYEIFYNKTSAILINEIFAPYATKAIKQLT